MPTNNVYYLNELNDLIGGKIIGTVSDEAHEFFGLNIDKDGVKLVLWFYSDDEGNRPGSYSIEPE